MCVHVVKAEQSDAELHLSEDEVLAQVGINSLDMWTFMLTMFTAPR